MADRIEHFHMLNGRARCAIAITTETAGEAKSRHRLDPLAAITLGRAISGSALLASTFKTKDQFVLCQFAGDGPLKKVICECNGNGDCRGFVAVPQLLRVVAREDLPKSVGEALGAKGTITVTQGTRGESEPHNAVTELANGEVASDIARYLTESEQIPSAVAAGVKLHADGTVAASGGILIQRLGGATLTDDELAQIEDKIMKLNISERIAAGATCADILGVFTDEDPKSCHLSGRDLRFHCRCRREKIANTLISLGTEEIKSIKAEVGKIEARCHFCSERYEFTEEELVVH